LAPEDAFAGGRVSAHRQFQLSATRRHNALARGAILTAGRLGHSCSTPVREILALTERPGVVSFAGGLPAPELFDVVGLREAFAAVLGDDSAARALQYSTTEGDPALRSVIAARLTARGLDTHAGDLLITSGSQQALSLVAAVVLEPGDRVLVEEPSYLAALQCFALARAVAVPVRCDDEGLDPDVVDELVAEHRPKLLYTVPTFHNPTGRTLPLARRRALVAAVKRTGVWLVEDDPYGELRYDGEALPALASLPGAPSRTLALSTLSKIAAPGLRLGWVRAPRTMLRSLTIAKQAADLHSSTVDQAAAARWMATTDLDAHIDRLRAAYRVRRDTLLDGLAAALPPGSTHNRPDGGMFVWARLPDGWDASALLPRALECDVAYVPGAPFFSGCPDPATLRLSFTAHPPEEIRRGLERLASALTAPGSARHGDKELS
jgi:2-aminoadipate transaminase